MPIYEEKLISPLAVRFAQQRIRPTFRDGREIEATIQEMSVESGVGDYDVILSVPFPAIEILRWAPFGRKSGIGEHWFSFDNRRLYCLQRVATEHWPKRVGAKVKVMYADSGTIRKKLDSKSLGLRVRIGSGASSPNELQEWSWRRAVEQRAPPGAFTLDVNAKIAADDALTSLHDLMTAPNQSAPLVQRPEVAYSEEHIAGDDSAGSDDGSPVDSPSKASEAPPVAGSLAQSLTGLIGQLVELRSTEASVQVTGNGTENESSSSPPEIGCSDREVCAEAADAANSELIEGAVQSAQPPSLTETQPLVGTSLTGLIGQLLDLKSSEAKAVPDNPPASSSSAEVNLKAEEAVDRGIEASPDDTDAPDNVAAASEAHMLSSEQLRDRTDGSPSVDGAVMRESSEAMASASPPHQPEGSSASKTLRDPSNDCAGNANHSSSADVAPDSPESRPLADKSLTELIGQLYLMKSSEAKALAPDAVDAADRVPAKSQPERSKLEKRSLATAVLANQGLLKPERNASREKKVTPVAPALAEPAGSDCEKGVGCTPSLDEATEGTLPTPSQAPVSETTEQAVLSSKTETVEPQLSPDAAPAQSLTSLIGQLLSLKTEEVKAQPQEPFGRKEGALVTSSPEISTSDTAFNGEDASGSSDVPAFPPGLGVDSDSSDTHLYFRGLDSAADTSAQAPAGADVPPPKAGMAGGASSQARAPKPSASLKTSAPKVPVQSQTKRAPRPPGTTRAPQAPFGAGPWPMTHAANRATQWQMARAAQMAQWQQAYAYQVAQAQFQEAQNGYWHHDWG